MIAHNDTFVIPQLEVGQSILVYIHCQQISIKFLQLSKLTVAKITRNRLTCPPVSLYNICISITIHIICNHIR